MLSMIASVKSDRRLGRGRPWLQPADHGEAAAQSLCNRMWSGARVQSMPEAGRLRSSGERGGGGGRATRRASFRKSENRCTAGRTPPHAQRGPHIKHASSSQQTYTVRLALMLAAAIPFGVRTAHHEGPCSHQFHQIAWPWQTLLGTFGRVNMARRFQCVAAGRTCMSYWMLLPEPDPKAMPVETSLRQI